LAELKGKVSIGTGLAILFALPFLFHCLPSLIIDLNPAFDEKSIHLHFFDARDLDGNRLYD
jgi:hypothetical protein